MSCGTQLTALDLVPILSYVFLCGRCRSCGSAISMQYPLVEISAGALMAIAYIVATSVAHILLLVALSLVLLFVAVYDMRHTIIPDTSIGILAVLAMVFLGFNVVYGAPIAPYLFGAVVAGFPIFLLWYFSSGRAMGFGDVKLAAVLGFFVYPLQSAAFLWIAFVVGGVIALALLGVPTLLVHTPALRQYLPLVTMRSEIPFGPFLVVGFLLVMFFGIDVFSILDWFTF